MDTPRRLTMLALDGEWQRGRWLLRGEAVLAKIDILTGHVDNDVLAGTQHGFFIESSYTVLRRPLFQIPDAAFRLFSRYDSIDLNVGKFEKTRGSIGDRTRRLTLGVAFRPVSDTVLRLSFWREWHDDFFNNRLNRANIQFGVATYF